MGPLLTTGLGGESGMGSRGGVSALRYRDFSANASAGEVVSLASVFSLGRKDPCPCLPGERLLFSENLDPN